MSKVGKDVLENTRATAMDGLLSVANYWGAGPAAESLIRRIFGKKELPTSAEIETAVTKIISSAKAKSNAEVAKLQNQLNDIPLVKSSVAKDAIEDYTNKLRNKILRQQANIDLADDIANSAINTAANISMSNASDRKSMAQDATKKAETAAAMYNAVSDPNKVEELIGGK